jgi:8-oxo-dGTP diphosphatase
MEVDRQRAQVRAAGGVVCRRGPGGEVEVALVHRPRYDDWSLPKGKLHDGEGFEDAALREVQEEIGVRCRLGAELPSTGYHDPKGRWKVVRYWLMEPVEDTGFTPNDEIDAVRWLPAAEAASILSYTRDAELVQDAARRLEADAARASR